MTLLEWSQGKSVKVTTANLTSVSAKRILTDSRSVNIAGEGLQGIIEMASGDSLYKPPSKGTMTTRIRELHDS